MDSRVKLYGAISVGVLFVLSVVDYFFTNYIFGKKKKDATKDDATMEGLLTPLEKEANRIADELDKLHLKGNLDNRDLLFIREKKNMLENLGFSYQKE